MGPITSALLVVTMLAWHPAQAWWGEGHGLLTRAAVRALPQEMPLFFRQGEETIANLAYDADLFKNRAVPHLSDAEHSEHYFDPELLEEREPPENRYEFIALCAGAGLDPSDIGFLPYAVVEWTERLAVALAEHQRWPENLPIQHKCLVYAGLLAHYAEDVCQPLHVTVHFDGRRQPDGSMVGRGIHEKVDALVERSGFDLQDLAGDQRVVPLAQLLPEVLAEIDESRSLIDRTYGLEAEMEDVQRPEIRAFALARARAAVRFTASLYLTAWQLAQEVELPSWHRR